MENIVLLFVACLCWSGLFLLVRSGDVCCFEVGIENDYCLTDNCTYSILIDYFQRLRLVRNVHCTDDLLGDNSMEGGILCIFVLFFIIYWLIKTIRDKHKIITKKHRENSELREVMQQLISFFTHSIYDLRIISSLIQAPVESVLNKGKSVGEIEPDCLTIHNNAKKLTSIIKQISDYNKTVIERIELKVGNFEFQMGNEIVLKVPEEDFLFEAETVSSIENAADIVVLVVDNNSEMSDFLIRSLGCSYELFTASNGNEAISLMEKQAVDVIISEMDMPVMDGVELLKYIRGDKTLCHIPFVFLSACNSTKKKIEGLELGADIYVEKPFSLAYLRAVINNQLAKRKLLFDYFESTPQLNYEKTTHTINESKWLDDLNKLLNKNLTNIDFSIEMVVDELSISRSSLQRKLKSLTGLAPRDYARLYKLKLAAKLLREGKYRVNEVCFMSGFNNHSYFSKCFKEQFGMLPKEYLENFIQKE